MSTILLYLILAYIIIFSLSRPWLPIVAYYINALLSPKYIWFWVFEDIPVSKILSICILASLLFHLIQGKASLQTLKYKQNYAMLSLWALIHLANIFNSFPNFNQGLPVELVLTTLNTVMIIYFSSQLLLTKLTHLKYLYFCMLVTGIYYTYWANMQYITGDIWIWSTTGRLRGPMRSVFEDENAFGLIFVVSMPFILFYAINLKTKLYKYCFLAIIPLLWHAIFLTGSRGALVGVVTCLLYSLLLIKSKSLNIIMVSGLVLALILQGGALLNRTENTIEKSESSQNEPIDPRLLSWEAGIKMIIDFPILGVGTEKFQAAYPLYMEGKVHVAHNTFFQIASNNGAIAGIIYIMLFIWSLKTRRRLHEKLFKHPQLQEINNASTASLVGFYATSMFLDLMIFEVFYYLLLLNIIKEKIITNVLNEEAVKTGPINTTSEK